MDESAIMADIADVSNGELGLAILASDMPGKSVAIVALDVWNAKASGFADAREKVIRECIEALKWFPASSANGEYWKGVNEARSAIMSLLPSDQGEAGEPLPSAPHVNAPVDRGPRADAMAETGNQHEITVRALIEQGWNAALRGKALPDDPGYAAIEAVEHFLRWLITEKGAKL